MASALRDNTYVLDLSDESLGNLVEPNKLIYPTVASIGDISYVSLGGDTAIQVASGLNECIFKGLGLAFDKYRGNYPAHVCSFECDFDTSQTGGLMLTHFEHDNVSTAQTTAANIRNGLRIRFQFFAGTQNYLLQTKSSYQDSSWTTQDETLTGLTSGVNRLRIRVSYDPDNSETTFELHSVSGTGPSRTYSLIRSTTIADSANLVPATAWWGLSSSSSEVCRLKNIEVYRQAMATWDDMLSQSDGIGASSVGEDAETDEVWAFGPDTSVRASNETTSGKGATGGTKHSSLPGMVTSTALTASPLRRIVTKRGGARPSFIFAGTAESSTQISEHLLPSDNDSFDVSSKGGVKCLYTYAFAGNGNAGTEINFHIWIFQRDAREETSKATYKSRLQSIVDKYNGLFSCNIWLYVPNSDQTWKTSIPNDPDPVPVSVSEGIREAVLEVIDENLNVHQAIDLQVADIMTATGYDPSAQGGTDPAHPSTEAIESIASIVAGRMQGPKELMRRSHYLVPGTRLGI